MKIRHWTIGVINKEDITLSILPTKEAIEKLRKILESNNDEVIDVITGPEVKCTVIDTDK